MTKIKQQIRKAKKIQKPKYIHPSKMVRYPRFTYPEYEREK